MSTAPCFINADYLLKLKEAKLLEKEDVTKIAELSRQRKLRNGKGYKGAQVRNFLLHGHTMTLEMFNCITDFYEAKLEMRKNLLTKQERFLASLEQHQQVA